MKKFFHILVALVLLAPMTTLSSCGDMHHLHGVDCPSGDCDDNANGGNNGGDGTTPESFGLVEGDVFYATVSMAASAWNKIPFAGDNGVMGTALSDGTMYQNYFDKGPFPIRVQVQVSSLTYSAYGDPTYRFSIVGVLQQ